MTLWRKKSEVIEYPQARRERLASSRHREIMYRLRTDARNEAQVSEVETDRRLDDWARILSRSWVPKVGLRHYPVGDFLGYGGREWRCRYIQRIWVVRPGRGPFLDYDTLGSIYGEIDKYRRDPLACIGIEMCSGSVDHIHCSRWLVDALHERLNEVWRQADGQA